MPIFYSDVVDGLTISSLKVHLALEGGLNEFELKFDTYKIIKTNTYLKDKGEREVHTKFILVHPQLVLRPVP